MRFPARISVCINLQPASTACQAAERPIAGGAAARPSLAPICTGLGLGLGFRDPYHRYGSVPITLPIDQNILAKSGIAVSLALTFEIDNFHIPLHIARHNPRFPRFSTLLRFYASTLTKPGVHSPAPSAALQPCRASRMTIQYIPAPHQWSVLLAKVPAYLQMDGSGLKVPQLCVRLMIHTSISVLPQRASGHWSNEHPLHLSLRRALFPESTLPRSLLPALAPVARCSLGAQYSYPVWPLGSRWLSGLMPGMYSPSSYLPGLAPGRGTRHVTPRDAPLRSGRRRPAPPGGAPPRRHCWPLHPPVPPPPPWQAAPPRAGRRAGRHGVDPRAGKAGGSGAGPCKWTRQPERGCQRGSGGRMGAEEARGGDGGGADVVSFGWEDAPAPGGRRAKRLKAERRKLKPGSFGAAGARRRVVLLRSWNGKKLT